MFLKENPDIKKKKKKKDADKISTDLGFEEI